MLEVRDQEILAEGKSTFFNALSLPSMPCHCRVVSLKDSE
jgi:hypothetical protein